MSKIVTLEDDVSMPQAPAMAGARAPMAQAPVYILRTGASSCGRCMDGRCPECQRQRSMQQSAPMQAMPAPVINLTVNPHVEVSPSISANGGNSTSEGSRSVSTGSRVISTGSRVKSTGGYAEQLGTPQSSRPSPFVIDLPQSPKPSSPLNGPSSPHSGPSSPPNVQSSPAQANASAPSWGPPAPIVQERVVERPVFIDRVKEVVRKIMQPMFMPVDRTVTKTVTEPSVMPVRYDVPEYITEPIPVRRDVPVDRPVLVPVGPAKAKGPRPPQPYQVAKNKKDSVTDVNYFA